jgi:ABC-type multidrug transport system fused ATPase/permease subunit
MSPPLPSQAGGVNRPPLLDDGRRNLFGALVATGMAQAVVAAGAAAMVGMAVAGGLDRWLGAGLAATAVLAGVAGLAERRIGERLAQSYVLCLRQRLFAAAIPAIGRVEESRLLLPFVGDLAAVRNWAARGPAALLTAGVASAVASLLLLMQQPGLAAGLLPLLAATLILALLHRRLGQRIADQRQARGQLTRYVLRRLRPPVAADTGIIDLAAHQRVRRADRRRLSERSERAAQLAIRRATLVGMMDGTALLGGGLAVLALLALGSGGSQQALIAALSLTGFVAARLLDAARALHALAGGRVALAKIDASLTRRARPPATDDNIENGTGSGGKED